MAAFRRWIFAWSVNPCKLKLAPLAINGIYCTRNRDQVQDKVTATSNIMDTHGQPRTVTKSRKSPPVALLRYTAKRHMATTPPLQTPTRHAACRGRPQQFQTDSYGTCRRRHDFSHARRFLVARPLPAATLLHYSPEPEEGTSRPWRPRREDA